MTLTTSTAQPRVLIVEDDRAVATFLADSLQRDATVCVARDGEEGLAAAHREHPDIILSDLLMPRMDGTALVQALRARPEFDNTPIIMLTSSDDYDLRVRLLRAGVQDYLSKPCVIEELRARLANLWSVKRAKEVLQHALQTQSDDLQLLVETLAQRDRELKSALDQMSVAYENAERSSSAKSAFLAAVSHELLTPIATIQLQLVNLARTIDLPDDQALRRKREVSAAALATLDRQCKRLAELIESVLTYVRTQSGKLAMTLEPVDMAGLVAEVAAELQPLAERKHLALLVDVSPALLPLVSDRRLIRLVITNLVSNAIKFTEQGGVTLALTQERGELRLLVSDSGPGIAAEAHEAIFEPFARLEVVANKHQHGLGLGLTLVRDIVTALGGHVDVTSEIDRGSVFTVSLPVGARALNRSA